MRLVIVGVLCLGACASDEPKYAPEDEGDALAEIMACPPGVPETELGMTADGESGVLRAELVDAEALPAIKGLNTWIVKFSDADGEDLDDVELERDDFVGVMPAHDHDTNLQPDIESLGDGSFEVSKINLHMDGRWLLTFKPTSDSLGADKMTFAVCTQASLAAAENEQ